MFIFSRMSLLPNFNSAHLETDREGERHKHTAPLQRPHLTDSTERHLFERLRAFFVRRKNPSRRAARFLPENQHSRQGRLRAMSAFFAAQHYFRFDESRR